MALYWTRCACYSLRSHLAKRGAGMSRESITQQVKEEISKLNQVLHLLEGTGVKQGKRQAVKAPRRKLSAAGRKRIVAAQRARWAKIRAAKK